MQSYSDRELVCKVNTLINKIHGFRSIRKRNTLYIYNKDVNQYLTNTYIEPIKISISHNVFNGRVSFRTVNALLYYLIDPQISFRGIAIKSLKANWRFSSSHKYLGQNKQRLVVDVVVLQSGKKIVLYDQSGWHNACCFCYVSTNECFLLDIILTEDILEDMLAKYDK